MNAAVEPGEKLGLTCVVCGTRSIGQKLERQELSCPKCGASFRTIEMAIAVLRVAGRGVPATLDRFAASSGETRILDLTADAALKKSLRAAKSYRQEPVEGPESEVASMAYWDRLLNSLARKPAASVDLLLLRDVLGVVPQVDLLLQQICRITAKNGRVIFQERFAWPLPAAGVTFAQIEDGLPIYNRPPTFVRIDGRREALAYRAIGADFVEGLRASGYLVHVDRFGFSIDPIYRSMVIVAQKNY